MVPGSCLHSFLDQMESLFIPAVVSSVRNLPVGVELTYHSINR